MFSVLSATCMDLFLPVENGLEGAWNVDFPFCCMVFMETLLPSLNSTALAYRRRTACCYAECFLHGLTEFIVAKIQEYARSSAGGCKHHEEWSNATLHHVHVEMCCVAQTRTCLEYN